MWKVSPRPTVNTPFMTLVSVPFTNGLIESSANTMVKVNRVTGVPIVTR